MHNFEFRIEHMFLLIILVFCGFLAYILSNPPDPRTKPLDFKPHPEERMIKDDSNHEIIKITPTGPKIELIPGIDTMTGEPTFSF